MTGRLSIAQVSPHPWGARHEINEFVGRTSDELAAARPPRPDRRAVGFPTAIRESRRLIREAGDEPGRRLAGRDPARDRDRAEHPAAERSATAAGAAAASTSAERSSACSARSRSTWFTSMSRSRRAPGRRRCGTRCRSTWRPSMSRSSGCSPPRWPGCWSRSSSGGSTSALASNEATGELLQRFFPGQYELVRPGADVAEPVLEPAPAGRLRIVHCAEEERGALRLLLRALRKLPEDLDWEGVIWFDGPTDPLARVSRRLRDRLRVVRPAGWRARGVPCGSGHRLSGLRRRPRGPRCGQKGVRSRRRPRRLRPELYRELVGEGERGLLFPLGDVLTLAAQLERLCRDAALRARLRVAARAAARRGRGSR